MCKVYVSHQLMADIIFSITSWCYFFCLLNAFHTLETIRYNRRTQTETLSTDSFSWLFSLLSLSLLCIWFHLFCGAFQSHFRYAIRSVSAFATHTYTRVVWLSISTLIFYRCEGWRKKLCVFGIISSNSNGLCVIVTFAFICDFKTFCHVYSMISITFFCISNK